MESTPSPLDKRKSVPSSETKSETTDSSAKRQRVQSRNYVHTVSVPDGYVCDKCLDEFGTLSDPVYDGPMAKTYKYSLDPFQEVSIACLERNESVLVSAHTSAGKTAVAEYAIALSLHEKRKVIYTSPIKALSNQKFSELRQEFVDVGLVTGDVSISPEASCLIMTAEILRGMLYKHPDILNEVSWIIFDEVHYMKDKNRGFVWEECIMNMFPWIRMVFLSATLSNASEFSDWICDLHCQPCHVVRTTQRPIPLQNFIFPSGGSDWVLLEGRTEQFSGMLSKEYVSSSKKLISETLSNVTNILKLTMEKKLLPIIIFSGSRYKCEQLATSIRMFNFNSIDDAEAVRFVFDGAVKSLNEEDRKLPAMKAMLPLLERGIGFHHSGFLPIIKELVELLFKEGLIKALFSTDTLSLGLNMPARTVVLTNIKKWDGDRIRYIDSGEYIQMSGRSGRRGQDECGTCITIINDQMDITILKDLIAQDSTPLLSTLKMGYYSLLNWMSRGDGKINPEDMIYNSFSQFQCRKNSINVAQRLLEAESELANLDPPRKKYHALNRELEGKLMENMLQEGQIADLYSLLSQLIKTENKMMQCPERQQNIGLKAALEKEIESLKCRMPELQIQSPVQELKKRVRVLEKLGHLDYGVVRLKGRVASFIDFGSELVVTELLFNGSFSDLDHHQVAALTSCFVVGENTKQEAQVRSAELAKPLQRLKDTAKFIAEVQRDCLIDTNIKKFVDDIVWPHLMDATYIWSKGATFSEIMKMTSVFEGTIISLWRRVSECLKQLEEAARTMEVPALVEKFAMAGESIDRGLMCANSLYV